MPDLPPSVVLRNIVQGRLNFALAAFLLEHTATYVAVHVPVGAPSFSRDGRRDGPRGEFLRPVNFAATFSATTWRGEDAVFVHRYGDNWSTWRWIDVHGQWRPGAYLNLEQNWRRTPIGWDTTDLTLDVVVTPDGAIVYKDEDELAWAEEQDVYEHDETERIRRIGQEAHAHASSGGWPLGADWTRWQPRPLPDLPTLHPNWLALQPHALRQGDHAPS